ncbi:MAG: tyrosine-type recombinase/integrase [Bryobacteraceae bacterium]
MTGELVPSPLLPAPPRSFPVPAIIADAGEKASEHFLEFFAATIRNKNTRGAYMQAVAQFCRWCEEHKLQLAAIRPLHMSAYIEALALSPPSVKQHLAALRGLFNWLVIRQVVPDNPAMFVKGPRFSRQIGVTPILEAEQMRALLDSIKVTRMVKIPAKHGGGEREEPDIKGLRDRAVIAIMAYTFARVSAVARLKRGDYRLEGKRARLRLLEKGNKEKLVWLHHEAEEFLDSYLAVARIESADAVLFPTLDKTHRMNSTPLTRRDILRIVKERCRDAGLSETFCNHTFRGTGITVFLQNGGTLEAAQDMANHSDPRTTKLYDRREDLATLSEIERRIAF